MATCVDTDTANACGYFYDTNATPVITGFPAVSEFKYDDTISFAGTSLTAASGKPALVLASPTVLSSSTDSTTESSTALSFKMPSIPNGLVSVNIYIPNKGYAKFTDLTNNPLIKSLLAITAVSPLTGSYGGNMITVTGSGFDANTEIILFKTWENKCEIRSMTATQIVCKFGIMSGTDGDQ